MLISKIVSGGQTGVDRGAIEAAFDLGFPYGGLIPKGRMAEDGTVPEKFDKMEVSYKKDYLFRTEWNVTHSDATLILSNYCTEPNKPRETLTGGTLRTERFCIDHAKPRLVLFTQNTQKVIDWLKGLGNDNIVLNVAGPRESKAKGIQLATKIFVRRLLRRFLPWGEVTENEYNRQQKLSKFYHFGGLSYSKDELLRGMAELKNVKIEYFAKYDGASIPRYITDADDIAAQIISGVPFSNSEKDECDYCGRMHLTRFANSSGLTKGCPHNSFPCPDDDGFLRNFTPVPSLLEIRFHSWFKDIDSDMRNAYSTKDSSMINVAERHMAEWHECRVRFEEILSVLDGWDAHVAWGVPHPTIPLPDGVSLDDVKSSLHVEELAKRVRQLETRFHSEGRRL